MTEPDPKALACGVDAYLLDTMNTLRGVKRNLEAVGAANKVAVEQDVAFLSQIQEAVVRCAVGALDLQVRVYGQDNGVFDEEVEGLVSFLEAM